MFGARFKLFRIFGFQVRADASWLLLAALITWSLAVGFFPAEYAGLSARSYWLMGGLGAIGLFVSIIFHELSHSIFARRVGTPIGGITLFMFGGVAELNEEPKRPKDEVVVTLAGPISSVVLGGLFALLALLARRMNTPLTIVAILDYLGGVNVLLAAFNMLPAFPLDGGRLLRAVLWSRLRDLRRATRIAARVGILFSYAFIGLGVFMFLSGRFVGGVWMALIGMFLRGAAEQSYTQLITRSALAGEQVRRFMNPEPIVVPAEITVEQLVEDYVYRYGHKMFPVSSNGRLVGCLHVSKIKGIPRDEWRTRTVGELASRVDRENTIDPDADALDALGRMNRASSSRLLVARGEQLVGIISLRDLLRFLSLKIDLEPQGA